MNILYIGAFRLPNYDAAAARVLNVAKALRECGHQVTFISWGGRYRKEDLANEGFYYVDGFRYIITSELNTNGSFVSKLYNRFTRGRKTKRLLNNWGEIIDAIITYNGSLTLWLLKFCRVRNIKLINDITEWYSYAELRPSEWIPYACNMFCIQKRVKNKIVISSYLNRFYNNNHNVVVPATCDSSESKWHKILIVSNDFIREFDGITLVYAGNPARKDLVHFVVNAVHRLAEEGESIRFFIIGTTRENYISHYASELHTKQLNQNIIFIGRVPQELIPSFYRCSDFMVLLRAQTRKSNAGFPTKFSESFTSGTPVIANLTSDLDRYLEDGKTGFVVGEPSENAIYQTLREKVLPLSRMDIATLKHNVIDVAKQLDYRAYIAQLHAFMINLQ